MRDELEKLIGKNFFNEEAEAADWSDFWPVVDDENIITAIVDGDEIGDGHTLLVAIIDGLPGEVGQFQETDGAGGFDAIRA